MQIRRQEILTGLLVLATVAVVTGALLLIGAPGFFTTMRTYYIHFDNVGGIKPGGPVLLAGRKIGQVVKLFSPVPLKDRPAGHDDYEGLVEVSVNDGAAIYTNVTATLMQFGLLGEFGIDFTSGVEASGRAPEGHHFIGKRAPDIASFMTQTLDIVKPLAKDVTATLEELRDTAANLNRFTAEGSELDAAMERIRTVGDNLVEFTKAGSPLWEAIERFKGVTGNLELISADLLEKDTINLTLRSFETAAAKLEATTGTLDDTLRDAGPGLAEATRNAAQLTDTLKRQPWRLLWPTTKSYPEDSHRVEAPPPSWEGLPVRRAIPVRAER